MSGCCKKSVFDDLRITFAGNWPTSARPVLEKVNQAYVIFFLIYITIIVFAAIRVISAVFLKDTLEAARNDDETLVIERLRNKQKYVQKLQEVFHAIGGSVDGLITEERLASILESPKALAYFQTLDLDVTETSALFSCRLICVAVYQLKIPTLWTECVNVRVSSSPPPPRGLLDNGDGETWPAGRGVALQA